jgi:SAM-dependent methyltransferase
MSRFDRYSAFYDLLYADKDYAAEADYVARALGPARSVLELGSGTGRHGRLLADRGFDVLGVELSAEMAAEAQRRGRAAGPAAAGSFVCEVGDLRSFRAGRTFDAVISLFHVISYQTGDDDLTAAFETAACHLAPGGAFLFDVWHGPAVLTQQPTVRTKQAADAVRRVRRVATPTLDADLNTVRVDYEIACEDLATGETTLFGETHLMRYLFPAEIGCFAAAAGFELVASEAFLTGEPPSPETWGVAYLLRKQ